ncbi:protein PROLIFERA, putative [Entamoeba invadens IP1]|uniref:DNA replication licensing factor MCM7 n=1 Tax=Entamoeba invadens IP1 TaxID=370355 RepID=A0A0A1TZT7_ENTIV|nr:protein PROLIFERA, putative [Entamoeba invadens IP1]ELP87124.1 protein PROLIFERA, putative [Entamoeba invadens IP1]|eukprot:XP_004253895.1 protein PROLIFERA, putative [Entamoeba invadens IP1]
MQQVRRRRDPNQMTIEESVNKLQATYTKDKQQIEHFLNTFVTASGQTYKEKVSKVSLERDGNFTIRLDDVEEYLQSDDGTFKDKRLMNRIEENAERYLKLFKEVMYKMLPAIDSKDLDTCDSVDILTVQREARKMTYPLELKAKFETFFRPKKEQQQIPIRDLRSNKIGKIVIVKGIVTRVTDVRPLARVITYLCGSCHNELYQTVIGNTFLPQYECPSKSCRKTNRIGTLLMQPRASKFVKVQEIRVQELVEEVPMGATPRALVVKLIGPLVQLCSPGDVVKVEGIYLTDDFYTRRDMHVGFVADTFLSAMYIEKEKKNYSTYNTSEECKARIKEEIQKKSFTEIYEGISASIAPEIYGMLELKKALLLTVVGAPTRRMKDGVNIRGDINTLLVGEPGIAKSQLLRAVAGIAPRSIYTTGKGSSGAGLTAAVMKDLLTKEWVLEGGALVLADEGICCIDEFDKMEEGDRTAIYEVMEQQTISIAKAGITTSLNARVSIVAAANPKSSRYNLKKSISDNVGLPAALVSRFDLLFVLLDNQNEDFDRELANFVCNSHRGIVGERSAMYDVEFIRGFIGNAKNINPVVPKELTEYLVDCYANKRQKTKNKKDDIIITPRSLLGIIRLSQSLARIRFSQEVSSGDVDEALTLINASREAIERFSEGENLLENNSQEIDEIVDMFIDRE